MGAIDLEMFQKHRRFEDPEDGFSEEFLQPRLGSGETVAILTRPLERTAPIGWVVCHSFGIEQIHLARLDVIAARILASNGFPVLRFFGQGYGDSEHGMEAVGLASHIAEAEDAVELLRRETGVQQVGTLGARFGGAVAALVAERLDLPFLGLWDPMVRGNQYVREILRSEVLSGIVESGEGGGSTHLTQIREELDSKGWTDIKGWLLSRQTYDEISAVDLRDTLSRFSGSALVVGLSRTPKTPSYFPPLSEAIGKSGGSCSLQLVQDPFAAQFGQFRWRTVEGGTSKRDTQLELNEKIADATLAWAKEQLTNAPEGAELRP